MTTGPSSSQTPYLVSSEPNVRFTSIATVGDAIGTRAGGGDYHMTGIPDGLGAYDNGDGTITLLMNHEIAAGGIVRAHGFTGSFVSEWVIDKATLAVQSAQDLDTSVSVWNSTTQAYEPLSAAISRLCSGDLPDVSAFYDAASGLGTQNRIYMDGEESGVNGRPFGHILTGVDAHKAFELPALGNQSFENAVASPFAQVKTIVATTDDASPSGQVYFYVGDKQATGSDIQKAGLTNGHLFGIHVDGLTVETAATTLPGNAASFTMVDLGDVTNKTGAEIETLSDAAGATEFYRPEDGAWDPTHPNWFYFVTTASVTEPSRLWRAEFTDITHPENGGTIRVMLDGSEGQRMLDNLSVNADGTLIMQEDVGNNARLGKVWQYDPATDRLTEIAQHDPARFGTPPLSPFTQDEESSGVIDVTHLLGDADTKAYLLDVQAHYPIANPELVEGGQLLVMYVDDPNLTGGKGADNLFGSYADETLTGFAGSDELLGGSGNDVLKGGAGDDMLSGGAGNDNLDGGADNDNLNGGAGDDILDGKAGNDMVDGGFGNDNLQGGAGNDVLIGGAGADVMKGGAGADTFVFKALGDSTVGLEDQITDFQSGDFIDLTQVDANTTLAGDQEFSIVSSFTGVAGQLVLDKHGKVYDVLGDSNGDGNADFVFHVTTLATLSAADFHL